MNNASFHHLRKGLTFAAALVCTCNQFSHVMLSRCELRKAMLIFFLGDYNIKQQG